MSLQTVCVLVQSITHPSCDAVQVDIQCKIEISWNVYWSLWGNQAAAAAEVNGSGSLEERKETIERGNENCGSSKNDETDINEFPVNKQEPHKSFVVLPFGLL